MEALAQRPNSIGKYRLIATLGQGGMAKVYLALMRGPAGFNKLLVIKALREDILAAHEDFVSMFLDEARLAARLSHPNVVQTYEVGEEQGRYFIAMEYLEGQTYGVVRRRLGTHALPLEAHLRVLVETARGLQHAHDLTGFDGEALDVVHRDVSPQNIFITYDGQIKLLDFGIAKMGDAEHLTQVGVVKGKAAYIAPEQVRGESVDRRADVFALGAMLWESLCGRSFGGGREVTDITKIHNRVNGKEPRIREVAPDVPEALAVICEKAISLDPNDRHQDSAEFADEIEGYLNEISLRPTASQLSALLETPFKDERNKMRKRVDEQVSLAQSASDTWDVQTGHLPALGEPDTNNSMQAPLPPDAVASGVRSADGQPAQPQGSSGGMKRLALILVACGIAAAVALWASDPPAEETPTADKPVATPIVEAPPEKEVAKPPPEQDTVAPTPAVITVRIAVEPANAQVTLDGAPVSGLPGKLRLPADGATHRLRATANGFQARDEFLVFDKDHDVLLQLSAAKAAPVRRRRVAKAKAPEPVAAPTPAPAPPASPPPVAKPAARPAPKPRVAPGMDLNRSPSRPKARKIYVDNPYQ